MFKDPKNLEPRYEILVAIDKTVPDIQYELPVWNVPETPVSYHIAIDQAPENLALKMSGPTKQLNFQDLPFSDSDYVETIRSSQPILNHISYMKLTDWKFTVSIPLTEGASTVEFPVLTCSTDYEANNINSMGFANLNLDAMK